MRTVIVEDLPMHLLGEKYVSSEVALDVIEKIKRWGTVVRSGDQYFIAYADAPQKVELDDER